MIWPLRKRRSSCRCVPSWPALVVDSDGGLLQAEPAERHSILTATLGPARCFECRAIYPRPFSLILTPPQPPKGAVCKCDPRWPELMVKVGPQWYLGHPGNDGQYVVDGIAEEAFCRVCAASFLGEMTLDLAATKRWLNVSVKHRLLVEQ
ncbi:hypothetical protein [Myceligenerans xiligouense]|uniref:Uncharacterized protein n=1 Tax=Myceligenerans xiligouense TaxID=253184 RepID=A0A3N4YIG2_9MICO|nr:hypothetical protein [Myceligenerans xiligouense]RPF19897.1 hypothetical protein EDD34_0468 [Myceligenerans xiligouense]